MPAAVKIACILTWVFSGLVALMYAGVLVALIAVQDQIVDYVVDSPEWATQPTCRRTSWCRCSGSAA